MNVTLYCTIGRPVCQSEISIPVRVTQPKVLIGEHFLSLGNCLKNMADLAQSSKVESIQPPVAPAKQIPDSCQQAVTAIFLQDACYRHRYIRSRDTSAIVERPERLRAVLLGLSAAIARLEELVLPPFPMSKPSFGNQDSGVDTLEEDLADALGRMDLTKTNPSKPGNSPVSIVRSSAFVDILDNPAVKFIHGDIDGDVYLEKLKLWAEESRDKIAAGGSEIPEGLPQGDLYRESILLIFVSKRFE